MNYKILIVVIAVAVFLVMLLVSRDPLIVDDVHPGNFCDTLLQKADVLYVIPLQGNEPISNDEAWCAKIRSLNKTLGMHGVRHTYHEFNEEVSQEEISEGIQIFEACFKKKPSMFRPPYNLISKQNKEKVEALKISVYNKRFFEHPYCHCDPQGIMKPLNWILFC